MTRMNLRRATMRDLGTLVRHRRLMFHDMGGHTEEQLRASDAPYRRWARARLRSGTLVAWVAEERGEARASGALWMQRVQPRPGWPSGVQPYLLSMYTEPAARGRGLAARIVKEAIAFAARLGVPKMTLHASDAGRSIYERLGWVSGKEMVFHLGGNTLGRAPPKPRLSRRTSRASTTRSGS